VVGLAAWAWWRRKQLPNSQVGLFALLAVLFYGLALGTRLRIYQWSVPFPLMPYRMLETLVPPLQISGVPMRMMVMVSLATAVLAAAGLHLLMAEAGAK